MTKEKSVCARFIDLEGRFIQELRMPMPLPEIYYFPTLPTRAKWMIEDEVNILAPAFGKRRFNLVKVYKTIMFARYEEVIT